ncbi:MipA/OmpV family protein [Mitsuaria sp. GD03876]|uniref:MipA/OmpV family protein n=1 Tax=Mitsuaria sp. GD03876 TaxID=2975399 RepID=UPI00244D4482|nr:MipA/OmpV family protein [Mitsuaria sp. GD03876]MDH0868036.1 MipA/OmpV family protein [Mitsuaria sp. GD03876]
MTDSMPKQFVLRQIAMHAGALAAALTCLSLFSCAARAQGAPAAKAPSTSTFTIGGGVAVGTRYSGSDETLVAPLIALEYAHSSGFFAGTLRGVGYATAVGPVTLSAAVAYRGKRSEKKKDGIGFDSGSKYLNGMGDVKGSVTGHLSASYAVLPWVDVQLHTEQPLTNRDNGALYSLGVSAKLLADGKDTWTVGLGATAADRKYMQTYHGVTAAQAARTGYAVFTPKSGFHQVEASASWQRQFTKNWSVIGSVGVQRLVGDASKSPLTRRATSPTGYVAVGYTF